MTAVELLEQSRACGVYLIPLPGGGLKLTSRAPIPADLKAELKAHKAQIMALLSEGAVAPASIPELGMDLEQFERDGRLLEVRVP